MGKRPSEHSDFFVRQQRRLRNVRRRIVGWVVTPLVHGLSLLPLAVLRALIGTLLGQTVYLIHRRRAIATFRRSFGERFDEAESRRIVRRACRGLGDATAELLRAWRKGPGIYEPFVHDDEARANLARIEASLGGGWIGVTGHIGNWELAPWWQGRVSKFGQMTVVAKRLPNPQLNRLVEDMRRKLGSETLYQDESPTAAIRAVRRGAVVGTVPDQDVKALSGMFIEFFGKSAYTPIGPARMAIAANAPIVCMFLLREGRNRFRVQVNDPIHPDPTLSRDEQILALTTEWSRQVETVIREHPEQWAWLHERWKTTPEKVLERARRR